ncbi:hypothetical protein KXV70_002244 [Aspergillus fumigatus]|nr:hypothetical protein CNMCM8714_001898 [Aspergillus fumigatus]KAF4259471.1 hypothetical protein CNMCM8057_002746 [Aspergillus fumigatus]KAF4266905.1 hypothetical protein CNMCM8812_002518 [Aspergillus fumigatus]KAH2370948.1 hypothetical protein KXV62_003213 [Aspergillus fumigatus]KAH2559374.1 hypothetical protein KXV70_002244 [Aspergillus fumigatus]
MKITALASAILAVAQGALALPARAPALDITLSQVNNTRIKAVVKNSGTEKITFVHLNFFNDPSPVKKVSLYRNATEVEFTGIKQRLRSDGLSNDALTTLAPGATYEDEFDIASTANLTQGGPVTVRTQGFVPIAMNNKIAGYIPYSSNELELEVDAEKAVAVPASIKPLDRRTKITSSCTGNRATVLNTALRNAASIASKAADAASSGSSALFTEYFKSTSGNIRSAVAARLKAVASEASMNGGGSTTYYCSDPYGYCDSNVLAYTLPSTNEVVNCELFYTLQEVTNDCHGQDQATTIIHEFTHAPGVYPPGTEDLGYGYSAATALSTSNALNNADSYALFANAVYLNCQGQTGGQTTWDGYSQPGQTEPGTQTMWDGYSQPGQTEPGTQTMWDGYSQPGQIEPCTQTMWDGGSEPGQTEPDAQTMWDNFYQA